MLIMRRFSLARRGLSGALRFGLGKPFRFDIEKLLCEAHGAVSCIAPRNNLGGHFTNSYRPLLHNAHFSRSP